MASIPQCLSGGKKKHVVSSYLTKRKWEQCYLPIAIHYFSSINSKIHNFVIFLFRQEQIEFTKTVLKTLLLPPSTYKLKIRQKRHCVVAGAAASRHLAEAAKMQRSLKSVGKKKKMPVHLKGFWIGSKTSEAHQKIGRRLNETHCKSAQYYYKHPLRLLLIVQESYSCHIVLS